MDSFPYLLNCSGLPFRPYESFGKAEQQERQQLLEGLVDIIWSPARLDRFRP